MERLRKLLACLDLKLTQKLPLTVDIEQVRNGYLINGTFQPTKDTAIEQVKKELDELLS